MAKAKNLTGNTYGDFTVVEMLYQYKIKQLVKRDVIFLNSLLLDYADLFFGYDIADVLA